MSRVFAVDPGAERLGWAVLDGCKGDFKLVDSGILALPREKRKNGFDKDEEFQVYKLRLINNTTIKVAGLFHRYLPTVLVSETVPAVGGGSFIAATQSELAKTAITVFQAFAFSSGLLVFQIGATTIKKRVAGAKDATKAKVRNGVIEVFPEVKESLTKETTGKKPVWDRSDGIATGIAHLTG